MLSLVGAGGFSGFFMIGMVVRGAAMSRDLCGVRWCGRGFVEAGMEGFCGIFYGF